MTCTDILHGFFSLFFFLFFFSLFLFLPSVHSKNHCPTSYCPNSTLPIQYPFKLQNQQTQNDCTYTNLRCSNQGPAILDLPNNGEFYVRDVDYTYSLIKLYDPDSCLPRRLMNFNLSSLDHLSPILYIDYTFYACPSDYVALSTFAVIDCMSNSSISTVATRTVSSEVMKKLYRCSEIVTTSIPVALDPPDFVGNQSDFFLTLYVPACENCPNQTTGFLPRYMLEVAFIMISFFTIIMPSVICIGCCVHFIRMFRKEGRSNGSNVA